LMLPWQERAGERLLARTEDSRRRHPHRKEERYPCRPFYGLRRAARAKVVEEGFQV
jgi:hypothetical protein